MTRILPITFLVFFCLGFTSLFSQITIEQEDYLLPKDFVDTVFWAQSQTIAAPSEGPDQSWDYGSLMHTQTTFLEIKNAAGNPHYTNASGYWESYLSFSGLLIPIVTYDAVDQDGSYYYAGDFYKDTTHSITQISGGPNDILNFPERFDLYDGRIDIVQFPVEYANMWDGSRKESTAFNLTVEAFNINQVPGNRIRYQSETREVTGWGEIIIPDAEGNPGNPIEVLQIKVMQNTLDSFFLGGMPAPPNLLAAFGLTQGEEYTNTFYFFLTKGLHSNVLRINLFPTGEVSSASYRPSANNLVSNTSEFAVINDFNLYPNPVKAGTTVTIETGDQFSAGFITITDLTGRQVHQATIRNHAGQQMQLNLPTHLISGNYFYSIFDHSGTFIGSGKINLMN